MTALAVIPDEWLARRTRPEGTIAALGSDPGGTTGLFLGIWEAGRRRPLFCRSFQCDMGSARDLAGWILDRYGWLIAAAGIEAFDARERSRKMRGFSASAMHALIADLEALAALAGIPAVTRPPAVIKNWATDKRLEAAGLIAATAGMPAHARDAARVCLFTACNYCGLADPLSRAAAR